MPDFEIDCKKLNWTPSRIDEVVEAAGRALETSIKLEELQLVGTDHIEHRRINADTDLVSFLKGKSASNEKILKFRIPERVVGKSWQPKKNKILATGKRIAKFFGDEQVSTRRVEFSLKLFDCGHFYLKQTLPGSGASPYWVIFEGKWVRHEKSLRLLCGLRYSWQLSKKDEDFAIEATQPRLEGTLAYCDENEGQLNGNVPTIVGQETYCWVELCREPDKITSGAARFNEEKDDDLSRSPPPSPKVGTKAQDMNPNYPYDEWDGYDPGDDNIEPQWPMYLGMAMFVLLFAVFAWVWWEERNARLEADVEEEEF